MGNINGGNAQPALKLFNDGAHLHAQLRIQVGKRLVHQQHARLDYERTGQRHTLLLTAGKLAGLTLCQRQNLHQFKRFLHARIDLALLDAARLKAIGNVLLNRQMRKNGVVLEHHADIAFMRWHVIDAFVAKIEVAALDGVEAGDHAQQRRLSAAGRAQERKELALLDAQGHVAQRGKIAIALDSIFNDDFVAHNCTSLQSGGFAHS